MRTFLEMSKLVSKLLSSDVEPKEQEIIELAKIDNFKLKKNYSANQRKLAEYKKKVQQCFDLTNKELFDILTILQNEDKTLDIKYINKLENILPELQGHLLDAVSQYSAYGEIRKQLISYQDKDDIHFVNQYIQSIQLKIKEIESQIELMEEQEKTQLQYSIIPENFQKVLRGLESIKNYIKHTKFTIKQIEKHYLELHQQIYDCSPEELTQRFHYEYNEVINDHLDIALRVFSVQPLSKRRSLPIIDIDTINTLQKTVAQSIRETLPELSLDEFYSGDLVLAEAIHKRKISHEQFNQLVVGYNLIQLLQEKKSVKTQKKRGPKQKNLFDHIDLELLKNIFEEIYQKEKQSVPKMDEFLTLFLIGMTQDNPFFLDRKLAECHRFFSNIMQNIRFNLRTIQRAWNKYINPKFERIQQWKDIVHRIMRQLVSNQLIFQLN